MNLIKKIDDKSAELFMTLGQQQGFTQSGGKQTILVFCCPETGHLLSPEQEGSDYMNQMRYAESIGYIAIHLVSNDNIKIILDLCQGKNVVAKHSDFEFSLQLIKKNDCEKFSQKAISQLNAVCLALTNAHVRLIGKNLPGKITVT